MKGNVLGNNGAVMPNAVTHDFEESAAFVFEGITGMTCGEFCDVAPKGAQLRGAGARQERIAGTISMLGYELGNGYL